MIVTQHVPQRRRDQRLLAVLLVITLVLVIGALSSLVPGRGTDAESVAVNLTSDRTSTGDFPFLLAPVPGEGSGSVEEFVPPSSAAADPGKSVERAREAEFQQLLAEAESLLDAKEFGAAVEPLSRAMSLYPGAPFPYVNMGYAQLGLGNLAHAERAFMLAIDIKPNEARAYFGLGIVYDRTKDFAAATGAMRSFLHLTTESDPYSPAVTRARSALWEWEAKLGRGPWGETRGIPPGLAEEDLHRDGQGVGMLKPQADGTSKLQSRPPAHFDQPAMQ